MAARGGYAAAEEPDGGEPDPAPGADQVVVVPGVVVDVAVGVVVVVGCGSVAGPAGLMMTVGVAWADPTAFVAAINTEAGRTESGAGVPEIVAVAASKVSPCGRGVPGLRVTVGVGAPVTLKVK